MRPLILELEGFTAYKDCSSIDFQGLQLVVLTGPNGSGKSSLLEAMIFALFGQAPRMRGKQSKDFISHGRDQFRIEFQFQVNGSIYRVQRRYFKKGQPQVRLQVKQNEAWVPLTDKVQETDKAITSLLQMGYDTFTKAVILPQNLFDQFLKGDKEKRREVLQEILSLELFEKIAVLAGEKSRILKEQIRLKEQSLSEMLEASSPENLETLRKSLEDFKQEASIILGKKKEFEEKQRECKRLSELRGQLQKLKEQEGLFLSQKEGWAKKEEEIARLKKMLPFLPDLTKLSEKNKHLVQLKKQMEILHFEMQMLSTRKSEMEAALSLLTDQEAVLLPGLKKRMEELYSLRETASRYEKEKAREREKNLVFLSTENKIKTAQSEILLHSKQKETLNRELLEIEEELKDLEKLDERFQLYNENLDSLSRLKILEQDGEDLEKRIKRFFEEHLKASRELEAAGLEKERLRLEIQESEKRNELLRTAWLVYELQGKLLKGESCPVCRQIIHEIPSFAIPSEMLMDLVGIKGGHQQILEKEIKIKEALSRLSLEMEESRSLSKARLDEKASLEKEVAERLQLDRVDLLSKARDQYRILQENQKKLKEARAKEEELRKKLGEIKDLEKKENELASLEQEKAVLNELLRSLREDLAHAELRLQNAGIMTFTGKEIEENLALIERQVADKALEKDNVTKALQEARAQLFHATKNMEGQALQEKEGFEEVFALNQKLEKLLPELGFASLRDVPEVEPAEIFRVEKELGDYRFELKSLEEKLKDIESQIGDKLHDPKEDEEIEKALTVLNERSHILNQEIAKTNLLIENLELTRKKTKTVQDQVEILKNKESIYLTIQQDLQKNRLPDFLLSTVLSTILEAAGEKFSQLSQGRYTLALEGTGEIQVLDGWNANEPRHATSLSGGESFAASLAVALALSEYLQGRQQVQSLFVDEGFGNLDRETRDKVAEVLASLQAEEKLIGIVTHLEELAELFPHKVIVEKLPEGSRIIQTSEESQAGESLSDGNIPVTALTSLTSQ